MVMRLSMRMSVEQVLRDLRDAIRVNRVDFIQREKNMKTLARLGLLVSDVYDELMNLTFSEYISGPEEDRDRPSSDKLWIFKKRVCGELLYIKFKIEYQTDGLLKVLSFHIDEP